MKLLAAAGLIVVLAQVAICAKKKKICSVTPNADAIDWDRLASSGKWYQVLNSNGDAKTTGSCTLIRVQEKAPGEAGISYDLEKVEEAGHTITVYSGDMPKKAKKKSSSRDAIISTMKVDEQQQAKLKLELRMFDVPPEYFETDYETYFIGKMCWNNEVYMWAYSKVREPPTSEYVDLFKKITGIAESTPVTFSSCEEVQDFSVV